MREKKKAGASFNRREVRAEDMNRRHTTRVVDKMVDVVPAAAVVLHEECIDSRLNPMERNLISIWNVAEDNGEVLPLVEVTTGGLKTVPSILVELSTISSQQGQYQAQPSRPTYSKPIEVAVSEVIAVERSRSYMRLVALDIPHPVRLHVRFSLVVDRRRQRSAWHHIRNPKVLREGGLKPGETRVVLRL